MRSLQRGFLVANTFILSLGAGDALAQSDELYFVETRYLANIYHIGTPCNDPAKGYELVVDTMLPDLLDESFVHGLLRFPVQSMMQDWAFDDQCRATRGTPASVVFRSDGKPFAEATFVINSFFDDVSLSIKEMPENDPIADRIYEIVLQGGENWIYYRTADDGYDSEATIADLAALIDDVPGTYHDDIYHTMALVLRNTAPDLAAEMRGGERADLSLLREAAEMGHEQAASKIFAVSGLAGYFHAYQSSASLNDPDPAATQKLLGNYGFIFDNVRERRNGFLISQLIQLERKGYSMAAGRVFEDRNLPPSGMMIEGALNSDLGARLRRSDGALANLYGLPSGLVFDCDGKWCNVAGGAVGRVRMNVVGLPDCEAVVAGETTCSFDLALNFDSGSSGLLDTPYNTDPVAGFALGKLESATNQSDNAITVTATLVRGNGGWSIQELAEE